NGLTSNGEALNFTVHTDANGVITITGVTAGGQEAVSITMTPSSLANGDVTVDLAIKQSLPLDHLNADGKFVDVTDGKITIDVPVQMQDTDGDPLMTGDKPTPINVTININDGANPEFGTDKGTTITETENGATASGQIPLDVGSDNIAHIDFAQSQPSLEGIISNNQTTRYVVDGNEIKVIIDGGANDGAAVMTIEINIDGSYTVHQYLPIEQDNSKGDT
ncbi:hypothetical protein, partial [Photobacterium angustum]